MEEDFLSNLNENLTTKSVDEVKNELFVSDVALGKIKFLTVVESIQGVLTNENVNIRERGVEFLSWILTQLPADLFNSNEIVVIVNFYCNCLKGHHNFLPATIKGLLAIVKMTNMPKEEIIKILVQLNQHVNCRTQLQPDRYNLFCILKYVIENYLKDLEQMGPDFVFEVISFIEGEADPSCLLVIFNFLPVFIKNFNLGHLDEELFEVLSCYFPVDFNSGAQNKIMITREDLAQGLIQCLSARDSFADQCMPMIFEKLDSTFKSAKLDSYQLLQECCKTLRLESLEKHLNELWKSFQKDVLPGNDKQVSEAGLLALTHVFGLLSKEETHRGVLMRFLGDILATVKTLLNRVDENLFQAAMKVLMAASAPSSITTAQVLCHLKPFFSLDFTKTLMERKIILTSLLSFLKYCHIYKVAASEVPEEVACYHDLVNLYLNSATSTDFEVRKLAFSGVSDIVEDFSEDLRRKLYGIVVENIKTHEDIKTSEEFLKVWRLLAQNHPSELLSILSDFQIATSQEEPYFARFLWSLSLLSDLPNFTGFVVPHLIKVIISRCHYIIGLESLLNACRFAKKTGAVDFYHVIHAEHSVIERLIFWWLELEPSGEDAERKKCLVILSEIIALVMRNLYSYAQQFIVDKYIQMFMGDPPPLNGGGDFGSPAKALSVDSLDRVQTVVILEAILGSVRSEITIPMMPSIREKLTSFALTSTDDSVRLSSSRLLASLVNKSRETLTSDLLTKTSEDITKQLEEWKDSRLQLNCAFLFTWLVKGVVLRGGQSSEEWISKWFDLLGRKEVGEAVAEGFRTVIEEDDLYLNLESHNNVRVLYRQRLFGYFPKLVKMYEASDNSVKMNYLLALVRLLQGLPNHLIQTEISNVVTLLAQCLSTDKPEVLLTSLEILMGLLESREKVFSDHINSFVPRFLRLCRFDGYMKIRMNALKCLYFYGFYPTVVLLPIKNQVVHDLEKCLDDKKRLVRKEAVKARCRWFLVGAPGEDILNS